MKLFGFLNEKEVPEVSAIEVPARVVENLDPRLIVKTGKKGKTVFMKTPCVAECVGCDQRFKPTPPDEGKEYCKRYSHPVAIWAVLSPLRKGEPKKCPEKFEHKLVKEDGKPVNPIKASKRGIVQSLIPSATGSKESGKKEKKKKERRDSK